MFKDKVHTPEEALLYLADCQLATVVNMASKKSLATGEYERQKSIAQTLCNWIRNFNIPIDKGNRIEKVKDCGWSTHNYSMKYDVKVSP